MRTCETCSTRDSRGAPLELVAQHDGSGAAGGSIYACPTHRDLYPRQQVDTLADLAHEQSWGKAARR